MANLQLIVERLISGKGVVKLPKQDNAGAIRYLILYADVVREPKNKYLNYNYNPPKGRYATLVFLRNGYVVDEKTLDYDQQSWDGIQDIAGQTLIAVKCAYDGILDTFVNLSIALASTPGGLGLAPLSKVDLIKDYENLYLSWDEIRVKCYADTAIQFRLFTKKYDTCNPDKDKQDKPPPPPPPRPKVPAGTPIDDISPPYSSGSNDDGNTDPFDGDNTPPPPPPDCSIVVVTTQETLDGFGIRNGTYRFYAPYSGMRIDPDDNQNLQAFCGGAPPADCLLPARWIRANRLVYPCSNLVVTSVTPE